MMPSKAWDATSLAWLIKSVDKMDQPQQPVGVFFGFRGMPATITVTKKDGVYVDGKKVEQPEKKEPQNGNQVV